MRALPVFINFTSTKLKYRGFKSFELHMPSFIIVLKLRKCLHSRQRLALLDIQCAINFHKLFVDSQLKRQINKWNRIENAQTHKYIYVRL